MNDAAKKDDALTEDPNQDPGTLEDAGGEDSGLADIRQVAAAMQAPVEESHEIVLPPEEHADDDLVRPDGGFGATAGASLVESPTPAPATEGAAAGGRSPMVPLLAAAIGILAVVGIGLAIVASGDDEATDGTQTASAAVAKGDVTKPEKKNDRADDDAAKPASRGDDEPGDEPAAAADDRDQAGDEPDTEPKDERVAAATKDKGDDSGRASGSGARTKKASDATKPAAKEDAAAAAKDQPAEAKPEPEPAPAKPITADCVLNPDLPECQRGSGTKKKEDEQAQADAGLPDKLTQAEVRNTLRTVKARAKACGPKHGGSPGTKVRIKISISGESGAVVSAMPLGDHADGPLGKCVADAIKQAKFSRFKKSVMGVTYPVTL